MKARDNKKLLTTIKHYESGQHTHAMGMHMFAIVGLISFGIMAVPIFTLRQTPVPENQVAAATTPTKHAVFSSVPLQAHSALVYDLVTHTVIYGQNANEQLPLASLTKLLTLYAAVSRLPAGTVVTISDSALAQEGDSGFTLGEQFKVQDLERLALVASSNDAAQALAEASAATQTQSSESLMASAAAAAGLTQTYAHNGTGLDVSSTVSGGYGSAQDVATLAGEILSRAPVIAGATTRPSVTATSLQGTTHTLENTNQSIDHVPNPLLSKTGFTDLAGGNLVVVFDAGVQHPVAVVVLGSTRDGRFTDVQSLVRSTLSYFAPAKTP